MKQGIKFPPQNLFTGSNSESDLNPNTDGEIYDQANGNIKKLDENPEQKMNDVDVVTAKKLEEATNKIKEKIQTLRKITPKKIPTEFIDLIDKIVIEGSSSNEGASTFSKDQHLKCLDIILDQIELNISLSKYLKNWKEMFCGVKQTSEIESMFEEYKDKARVLKQNKIKEIEVVNLNIRKMIQQIRKCNRSLNNSYAQLQHKCDQLLLNSITMESFFIFCQNKSIKDLIITIQKETLEMKTCSKAIRNIEEHFDILTQSET